jgi:predicted GIY-YIG superfamily endonuclease
LQKARHALSRRDQRYRSTRLRTPHQSHCGIYGAVWHRKLVWFEVYDDPLAAIAREKELKKWRRDWKIRLIEEENPGWVDLYPGILN